MAASATTASVPFNVFYDPSLALHLSKGWQLSQLLRGKVATLSANRFVVEVPTTDAAKARMQRVATNSDGRQQQISVNAHTASTPTEAYLDLLEGMSAEALKCLIVEHFNSKVTANWEAAAQNQSQPPTDGEKGRPALIDASLATLAWGSSLLVPEDTLLANFGLTSYQRGSTLVLETYGSWAERLNAISFAAADPKNKKDLSGVPDEMPTSSLGGGADTSVPEGPSVASQLATNKHTAENIDQQQKKPTQQKTSTLLTDDDRGAGSDSDTSDDDDDDDNGTVRAPLGGGIGTLQEAPVPARIADKALVRKAMEERLAKMQKAV